MNLTRRKLIKSAAIGIGAMGLPLMGLEKTLTVTVAGIRCFPFNGEFTLIVSNPDKDESGLVGSLTWLKMLQAQNRKLNNNA